VKIYRDTREQKPFDFTIYGFEQEDMCLDVGDYYVDELPDLIIERKRNTGEISLNLGSKWKQFEVELKKMAHYKNTYIICEFPISDLDIFPVNSGIPKNKIPFLRMNAGFIKHKLFSECNKYNIHVLFFNNAEEALAGVVNLINNGGKLDET
jgi:ERCC4-type nuclease